MARYTNADKRLFKRTEETLKRNESIIEAKAMEKDVRKGRVSISVPCRKPKA